MPYDDELFYELLQYCYYYGLRALVIMAIMLLLFLQVHKRS